MKLHPVSFVQAAGTQGKFIFNLRRHRNRLIDGLRRDPRSGLCRNVLDFFGHDFGQRYGLRVGPYRVGVQNDEVGKEALRQFEGQLDFRDPFTQTFQ